MKEETQPNIIALSWQCPQCHRTVQTVQIKRRSTIWHCSTCKYHHAAKPTTKAGQNLTRKITRKMKRRRARLRKQNKLHNI